MKLNNIYRLTAGLVLMFAMLGQGLQAQTRYNLSFENPKLSANPLKMSVDIMISFNEAGQLGSSNFVIDYDPEILQNPTLESVHLSDVPTYQVPTLTQQLKGRISFNVELVVNGSGDKVGKAGNEQKLARLSFDLASTRKLVNLNWYESDSRGTVVFSDDPRFTQLIPGKMEAMTFDPSEVPAQDLILTAVQKGLDAQLDWVDNSSLSDLEYEIERSLDGQLFEIIKRIPKNGGNGQAYQYFDEGVVNHIDGVVYYRLKQKELDGTFIASNTVELTLDELSALDLQAFPNPVKDDVKIQWVDLGGTAEIRLLDAKGKLVRRASTEPGQSSLAWDLSKVSSGFYFIEYKNIELQQMRASIMVQVE